MEEYDLYTLMNGPIREKLQIIPEDVIWDGNCKNFSMFYKLFIWWNLLKLHLSYDFYYLSFQVSQMTYSFTKKEISWKMFWMMVSVSTQQIFLSWLQVISDRSTGDCSLSINLGYTPVW